MESAKKSREERKRELAAEAERLYKEWGDGPLNETISEIEMELERTEGPSKRTLLRIEATIKKVMETAVNAFLKRTRPVKREEKSIWGYKNMEVPPIGPLTPQEYRYWLLHAKGAAFRIEQFHSHANYSNPHPKKEYIDKTGRDKRSEKQQRWLEAEDAYSHLEALTGKKRKRKGKGKGKGKKSEGILPTGVLEPGQKSRMTAARLPPPSRALRASLMSSRAAMPASRGTYRPRAIPAFPSF